MEKQSLITRIGFCATCEAKGYPIDGQLMLLQGTHGFHVDVAHPKRHPHKDATTPGFVPHLYKFIRTQGNIVIAKSICCINGCDVTLRKLPSGDYEYMLLDSKWKEIDLLISDWNALLKYKRDNQFII
jgi:hypothetical protein